MCLNKAQKNHVYLVDWSISYLGISAHTYRWRVVLQAVCQYGPSHMVDCKSMQGAIFMYSCVDFFSLS